jgi:phage recombination protein Bet
MNAQNNAMQVPESDRLVTLDLVKIMAKDTQLDPAAFASTVMRTCFQENVTKEQFIAFLMIAKEHKLNPITREIYAFAKGGKVTPIVSIDGWLKIINTHPHFDGMDFADSLDDDGKLVSVTCKIYRKDRKHPTLVTEYLSECKQDTIPWNKWPIRMLRHKATIQCARYAFGFAGIYDADEGERILEAQTLEGVAHSVDEPLESSAKRIAARIKDRVEKEDLAPENDVQEPVEVEYVETLTEDGQVIREPVEVTTPAVEDIPGIKRASEISAEPEEMSDEHKEFVADMEKAK